MLSVSKVYDIEIFEDISIEFEHSYDRLNGSKYSINSVYRKSDNTTYDQINDIKKQSLFSYEYSSYTIRQSSKNQNHLIEFLFKILENMICIRGLLVYDAYGNILETTDHALCVTLKDFDLLTDMEKIRVCNFIKNLLRVELIGINKNKINFDKPNNPEILKKYLSDKGLTLQKELIQFLGRSCDINLSLTSLF